MSLPFNTLRSSGSGSRLSELEARALEIIRDRGDEGIYQHELWKLLGIDSREGSRLALRLLKKGFIVREPVVHNGHRTYRLMLAKPMQRGAAAAPEIVVSLNMALEVPCFTCPHLERCHEGGYFSPSVCPVLSKWLNELRRRSKL